MVCAMLAGAETRLIPLSENACILRQKWRREIFTAPTIGLMRERRNA
jgi:hypothetical protein